MGMDPSNNEIKDNDKYTADLYILSHINNILAYLKDEI